MFKLNAEFAFEAIVNAIGNITGYLRIGRAETTPPPARPRSSRRYRALKFYVRTPAR